MEFYFDIHIIIYYLLLFTFAYTYMYNNANSINYRNSRRWARPVHTVGIV